MTTEPVPEHQGGENYCINCGVLLPFSGNPFVPGTWMCEECRTKLGIASMASPQR